MASIHAYSMSNTNATEENVEFPSTYGEKGYRNYRRETTQMKLSIWQIK